MISYEGQRVEDLSCYLSDVLAPLQPVILWGRTASAQPVRQKQHVVYDWWKDWGNTSMGLVAPLAKP